VPQRESLADATSANTNWATTWLSPTRPGATSRSKPA